LPVLIHIRGFDTFASSTLIFASTVKPLASGDYFVTPERGQCRFKQMTEPGINCLPQRIDDKIGRLVREGGGQRPRRPERKFNLSQCGTQLSITTPRLKQYLRQLIAKLEGLARDVQTESGFS
jgi:hypothetical protein